MLLSEFKHGRKLKNTSKIGHDQQQKIIEYIHKHCQDILMVYAQTNDCLYKGLSNDVGQIMMGKSEENREPKDTPKEVQVKVDSLLQGAGFTALRRNSFFCISDVERAEYFCKGDWTRLYVVFPLDGFEYTWSATINDFSEHFGLLPISHSGTQIETDNISSFENLKPNEFVKKYDYYKTNIQEAIILQKEVMIRGSYILIKKLGNDSLLDTILGK